MKNLGVVSEPDDIARLKDIGAGTGDVTGPASSTDGHAVVFNGTDGKTIKDGGVLVEGVWLEEDVNGDLMPGTALLSGVGDKVAGPASVTADGNLVLYDGVTGKIIKDGGVCTAAGLALLDDANAVAQIATLGAAAAVHSHAEADVTDLVTDLAGKAAASHTHAEADVTNLTTDLAGKAPTSHTHTKSQITDFPASMPASDVSAWAKEATKPTYAASEISIADAGSIITATTVEDALQENRIAINLNTAKATNATHTGEVTGSGALTITAKAVTYAKIQDVSGTDHLLGRASAGAGVVEEIACTATGRSILDDTSTGAVLTTIGALPLAGGTMTGDITLDENTAVALDPAGSADEKWSGITVAGTAGVALAVGDLCYCNSAFKWVLADANAAASAGAVALGLCVLAAAGDTSATKMLLMGTMRSAVFPASITGGAQLYVSTTAGDMTTTQPSGVDDVIRVCGWAILTEPNTIYFNPSPDFITHV